MTAPSLAIAVLTTGERVPLTDSWKAAQELWRDGRYDPDDVLRIEQEEAAVEMHSGGVTDTQTVTETNHLPVSTQECRGALIQKGLFQ